MPEKLLWVGNLPEKLMVNVFNILEISHNNTFLELQILDTVFG